MAVISTEEKLDNCEISRRSILVFLREVKLGVRDSKVSRIANWACTAFGGEGPKR
jgi:hypothetical protein